MSGPPWSAAFAGRDWPRRIPAVESEPYEELPILDRVARKVLLVLGCLAVFVLLLAYEYYPMLSPPRYDPATVLSAGPLNAGKIQGIRERATVQLSDGAIEVADVNGLPGYSGTLPGGPLRPGEPVTVLVEKHLVGPPNFTVVSRH